MRPTANTPSAITVDHKTSAGYICVVSSMGMFNALSVISGGTNSLSANSSTVASVAVSFAISVATPDSDFDTSSIGTMVVSLSLCWANIEANHTAPETIPIEANLYNPLKPRLIDLLSLTFSFTESSFFEFKSSDTLEYNGILYFFDKFLALLLISTIE